MNAISLVPNALTDDEILAAYDDTFEAARRRFRLTCAALGLPVDDIPIGSSGSTLCRTEFGPRQSDRKLVVISGVHGIEAFCGSATQVTFLQRYASKPIGAHVVVLHIVNPWGAQHHCRTTAQNVDLNRNVVDNHVALAKVDAGSRAIGALFSDRRMARLPDAIWLPVAIARMLRLGGLAKLRGTLAGGQFFDPDAPFFGGTGPADEVEAMSQALQPVLAGASPTRTIFFDLHSGIGDYAVCSLLANGPSGIAPEAIFKAGIVDGHAGSGAVYPVRGDIIRGLKACLGLDEACGVTFECGTGPALSTLLALRAANSAHALFPRDQRRQANARDRMIRAFCPQAPDWRVSYVRAAHTFLDRALEFSSVAEREVAHA